MLDTYGFPRNRCDWKDMSVVGLPWRPIPYSNCSRPRASSSATGRSRLLQKAVLFQHRVKTREFGVFCRSNSGFFASETYLAFSSSPGGISLAKGCMASPKPHPVYGAKGGVIATVVAFPNIQSGIGRYAPHDIGDSIHNAAERIECQN